MQSKFKSRTLTQHHRLVLVYLQIGTCFPAQNCLFWFRLGNGLSLASRIGVNQHLQSILKCPEVVKYAHDSATYGHVLKYSLHMSAVQVADVQVRHMHDF